MLIVQLESLAEWLRFLTNEQGAGESDDRRVFIHSFSDDAATLVFEKYEAIGTAAPKVTKYIVGCSGNENRLYAIIQFLAENSFSCNKIWQALESMPIRRGDEADDGTLGSFNVLIMKLGGEQ